MNLVCLYVIWIKNFDIDYVIEKVVRKIFDINFFYLFLIHLYTNGKISMELLTHFSHNI